MKHSGKTLNDLIRDVNKSCSDRNSYTRKKLENKLLSQEEFKEFVSQQAAINNSMLNDITTLQSLVAKCQPESRLKTFIWCCLTAGLTALAVWGAMYGI